MKTHNKITILLSSIITVLILSLIGYQYIRNQEDKLYIKSKLASDENVIDKVMDFKDRTYINSTEDNSTWNDMVRFIQTRDTLWAKENLNSIVLTIDLSYMGIYDTSGNHLYSVSETQSKDFKLPTIDLSDFNRENRISHRFIKNKGSLYEIFATKIVPSADIKLKTKPRGYLVSVKQWDDVYLKDLEGTTGFNIELKYSKPDAEEESNTNEVAIIRELKDFQGNTLAFVLFKQALQYQNQFKYLRLITIAGVVVLALLFIVFIYLMNRWIANPLKDITLSLSENNLDPIEHLLKQKGSFTQIANLIKSYTEQKKALISEIIERKAIENNIIKQKILFEQLFKNAPIGIMMLDKNECVLDINPVFSKLFDFKLEDIHGRNMNDFLVPANLIKESHELSNHTIIGDVVAKDTIRKRKDGSLIAVSVYGVPIDLDSERIGIYGMYIDITERQKAAIQLETYSQKLKELNITKDKFFSIIAHDLKSPFNSITGFSEFLLDNYSDIEVSEIQTSLRFIQSSSKHAFNLLENLLVWARSQTQAIEYKPIQFNLKEGIYDTVLMAENIAAKKQIHFDTVIDDKISITADINMLNTIVRNILSNATKFTPINGQINLSVSQDSDSWIFSILDTGVGIDPKSIDKLFKIESKFSTFGTENESGTGLGLILCKEFVEKHGGKIWVESAIDQGTIFRFSIPKA